MADRYCYLVMVDFTDNHNKFYEMQENSSGVDVKYGRIGEKVMTHHYNRGEKSYDALKAQKLAKGYKDMTNYHTEINGSSKYDSEKDAETERLAQDLLKARRALIGAHYLNPSDINENMVYAIKQSIAELEDCVAQGRPNWRFTQVLEELCHISPRKTIYEAKARDVTEQLRIIEKEKDLLEAVEAELKTRKVMTGNKGQTLFGSLGLEIRPVTYAEEDEILSLMHRSQDKTECVAHAYRIVNKSTTEAYQKCKADMNIPDAGCRLLFHGSDNGNWLSIIEKGLLLDPDARITAKGLGHGLYFADDVVKSLNYNSDPSKRYIGIYEVATGKEWDTNGVYIGHSYARGSQFSFRDLKDGCQSVFLDGRKIRPGHLNEYCVYKQEQANIKYLVCCERERHKDVRYSMHLHLPFENLERNECVLRADAVLSDYAKDRLGKAFGMKVESANAVYSDMFQKQEFSFFINGSPISLTKDENDRLFKDFKKSFFESERDFEDNWRDVPEKDEPDIER